jgi:hypothetical protein
MQVASLSAVKGQFKLYRGGDDVAAQYPYRLRMMAVRLLDFYPSKRISEELGIDVTSLRNWRRKIVEPNINEASVKKDKTKDGSGMSEMDFVEVMSSKPDSLALYQTKLEITSENKQTLRLEGKFYMDMLMGMIKKFAISQEMSSS